MSDQDLMMQDNFEWNEEVDVDLTEPSSGQKRFSHIKMYVLKVTKTFEGGKHITIPGVVGGENNEKDENGNMKFGGWLPSHVGDDTKKQAILYVLVDTRWRADGSPYQVVKQYTNKNFDRKKKHYWAEFVYPAINQLNAKKLTTDGLYVEHNEAPTGDTYQGNDVLYWSEYKVYPDKEALDAANKEFFAQFKDNGKSEDFWPETWVASNSVEKMVEYAKGLKGNHAEIATALMLNDAVAANGDKVNVALVLSKCLDVPEPMIQL